MDRVYWLFLRVCFGLVPIIGVVWIFSILDYLAITLTFQEVIATILGIAMAAAVVKHP